MITLKLSILANLSTQRNSLYWISFKNKYTFLELLNLWKYLYNFNNKVNYCNSKCVLLMFEERIERFTSVVINWLQYRQNQKGDRGKITDCLHYFLAQNNILIHFHNVLTFFQVSNVVSHWDRQSGERFIADDHTKSH